MKNKIELLLCCNVFFFTILILSSCARDDIRDALINKDMYGCDVVKRGTVLPHEMGRLRCYVHFKKFKEAQKQIDYLKKLFLDAGSDFPHAVCPG